MFSWSTGSCSPVERLQETSTKTRWSDTRRNGQRDFLSQMNVAVEFTKRWLQGILINPTHKKKKKTMVKIPTFAGLPTSSHSQCPICHEDYPNFKATCGCSDTTSSIPGQSFRSSQIDDRRTSRTKPRNKGNLLAGWVWPTNIWSCCNRPHLVSLHLLGEWRASDSRGCVTALYFQRLIISLGQVQLNQDLLHSSLAPLNLQG